MSLETYAVVTDLYLARGQEVNSRRPFFTGDVFADVLIPGIQEMGKCIVIAHPCAMRGPQAELGQHVLVAAVRERSSIGQNAWTTGYYDLTPLPELTGTGLHVGHFQELGKALTDDLTRTERLACLSEFGVNLLHQRLIWHLTRLEVPTFKVQEAFAHTFEEADILEEWNDTVCSAGLPEEEAAVRFELLIREDRGNGRTLQSDLRDAQLRSAVRVTFRTEARKIAEDFRSS